ncbi:MAG TPA: hypothetical protein VKV34_12225, partial [Thermoleophilia bacterium]|nr:hypothetical protein [Thermoleophilia bacterium]
MARREGARHPRIAWAAVAALAVFVGLGWWVLSGLGHAPTRQVVAPAIAPLVRLRIAYAVTDWSPGLVETSHVVVADVNGADAHSIGTGSAPLVSPDGRWVAYSPASSGIRVVSLGGGHGWTVAVQGSTGNAVWAPDSRDLAVVVGGRSYYGGIVLIPVQPGARPIRLTRWQVMSVGFSPDGRAVVYDTVRGQLVTQAVSGGTPHVVLTASEPEFSPVWTRSGIVYGRGGDLWIVQPDGKGNHRL